MRKKSSSVAGKNRPAYPERTDGARLAAEIRQRANKLTPEQRREHLRQAMALIYADKHLLDIDEPALLLALGEADLGPVSTVHPKRLAQALR